MCVNGPYERTMLLDHGGFLEDEVVVTGSPRPNQASRDELDPRDLAAERAAVRRELDVADEDRLLVVSSANLWLVRDVPVVDWVAGPPGGPRANVHIVVKRPPGEGPGSPTPDLLCGLATAGGYRPPPISVIRDIDLYRLLRAADAHLGLHSTVLTDAVIAGTP